MIGVTSAGVRPRPPWVSTSAPAAVIASVASDVELVSERKKLTLTTETPDPEDLKPWEWGGGGG